MISKYLTDIGVKEKDIPCYWLPDDPRQEYWDQEKEQYGFDSRDTWSLDHTIALLIYPRLKMYNEINCIDTTFYTVEHNGEILTQQQCIDKILKVFERFIISFTKSHLN